MVNKKITRQLYFAFICSQIKYGIEVYGSCSNELINRLQVIQNGLLKCLLCIDRQSSTKELHLTLRLLKVRDIHKSQVLLFVNQCLKRKSIPYLNSYILPRVGPYDIRNRGLEPDFGRINIGYCDKRRH